MVSINTFINDILSFIKTDLLANITDPISGSRSGTSKFVMTSYPQRKVQYPLITLKITNQVASRAGMQVTTMDVGVNLEIRIWARNEKEKDTLSTKVYDRLRSIQFTTTGSTQNDLHDYSLLSMNEVDEPGEQGIKSRILQIGYTFWNVS